ncbi:hypothetical protein DSL92_00450 [Billgrantia gudaonensis]|uniref:Solute-binding protein family 5 domain-containing protein n=1 Tax=Billgrantia gudaonensis TaxID=376427 RepID=A0A3S0QGE0_9GAMM|nr:hypothetical protein DSL92_00450 [Halomonas gudaonensis]
MAWRSMTTPPLPTDFTHFPHVIRGSPRGGSLTRAAVGSSFDSTFIIRGTPAAGGSAIYDTSARGNPTAVQRYGLLAEGLRLDPERHWIEFDLRPEAHFHDGEPVTAADVVYSFDLLIEGRQSHSIPSYYAEVASVEAVDERTVRFTFDSNESRELPALIVGQFRSCPSTTGPSVISAARRWHLIRSGLRIAEVDPGRRIVYERDPDYWGRDFRSTADATISIAWSTITIAIATSPGRPSRPASSTTPCPCRHLGHRLRLSRLPRRSGHATHGS